MRRAVAVLLALLTPAALHAAPTLHPLFSDHAVLQRERPILVWGTADPGERVKVTLGSTSRTATADSQGAWRAELPAMAAGRPYTLSAVGSGGSRAAASDILIGDVWLCSGQSNMEWPVNRSLNSDSEVADARDRELRILTVEKRTALEPLQRFGDPVAWAEVTPESIPGFSAACYFMARDLRASQEVPIGAIDVSWGGTAILPWIDIGRAEPFDRENAGLLALYQRDRLAANRRFGTRWQDWWRSRTGSEPWRDSSVLKWRPVPSISYWEGWGDPQLKDYNGTVWMRRKVDLSEAEAAQGVDLSLGTLDDIDQTFVNGTPVGNSFGWDAQREYSLPSGIFRAGENEILIAIHDSWGAGGFQGPAERLRLAFEGGGVKPLGDGWEYALVRPDPGTPPRTPWDSVAGASLIYNGMIAPLGPFGLKGAAWYQGESDAGDPAPYADKLAALIASWRRQFGAPDLPFLIVSLANFGAPATAPRASGWAELREQQRLAAARDPNAAIVIAMDLGERQDIHPTNKQEVGKRLARAGRALAYRGYEPASGPEIARAVRSGNDVLLEFSGVTGSLGTWSGEKALAFELCAETQQSCRWAEAIPQGTTVRVIGDGQPVTRVRYAWGEFPVVNLYDDALLPAGPFEIAVR